jgi:protein-S-isoprenylcysteine O-methyltransferase Ste14
MSLPWRRSAEHPPQDPAACHAAPWPIAVVLALAVAGVISPLIPLGAAVVAYALADEDQAMLLIAAGIVHVIMALTFLAGT